MHLIKLIFATLFATFIIASDPSHGDNLKDKSNEKSREYYKNIHAKLKADHILKKEKAL